MIKGSHHTEETKQKISLALKGRAPSKGFKGYHHSEKTKRKISQTLKGKPLSEETKQKISQSLKGHSLSKETKKKLSLARLGKRLSKEAKQKISRANRGRQYSEETKRKMSAILKERYKIPENHPFYGRRHTEEFKARKREQRLKQIFPQKNTSIETALKDNLNQHNISYQTHLSVCDVCIPDIVFPESKIAVFADGDYWHSKSFKNGKVWERDRRQDQVLRENGWIPLRFWGHEINADVVKCVDRIIESLGVDLFG